MRPAPPAPVRWAVHAAVYAAAATMLAPFAWMILTALKSDAEALDPSVLVPADPRWDNFARAWASAELGRYAWNSLVAAVVTTVFGVLHNALAGYAFAKLRFRGRSLLLAAALATMMVPVQVWFLFAYLVSGRLGLVDTPRGLYLPFLASGFGIFYLRQAILSVPDSLLEAGRMDGMREFELFWRLVTPTVWPSIAALAIFTFVFSWNNFFWPLIIADSDAAITLPLAVSYLSSGRYVQSWPVIMAALTILTLPLLVVFVLFQRAFVEGVALTGVKE